MANTFSKLETGNYYHIYNRGINSHHLFECEEDYLHFLNLYQKFINPVAETIAWVLMPNHFHLLLHIKENVRYKYTMKEVHDAEVSLEYNNSTNAVRSVDADRLDVGINKWVTECYPKPDGVKDPSALKGKTGCNKPGNANGPVPSASKHLSHLFNAYAKYYNTRYNRHGALFERPFKRKLVTSQDYLRRVIIYIHKNPVHHGFNDDVLEYGWSSYINYIDTQNTVCQQYVTDYFGDIDNFMACHQNITFDEDILE